MNLYCQQLYQLSLPSVHCPLKQEKENNDHHYIVVVFIISEVMIESYKGESLNII